MDKEFIKNRITELRIKKNVSEYRMSLDLGQNRSYIQAISSGRALPSMAQFLKICDYFDITPLQFFDSEVVNPQLLRKAVEGMRKLTDDDLIMLIGFINRLAGNQFHINIAYSYFYQKKRGDSYLLVLIANGIQNLLSQMTKRSR